LCTYSKKTESKMRVGILDYGAGNIRSVKNAFESFNVDVSLTSDLNKENYDALVLPGVGNFESVSKMKLDEETLKKKPFLGICLGLQALFEGSNESKEKGLGILKGKCVKFKSKNLKVPHMGWNEINLKKKIEILDGTEGYYYFAHSFYAIPKEKDIVYATCNYGVDFPAVIIKENIIATQFHPEKSGASGLKFIENFVNFVKK